MKTTIIAGLGGFLGTCLRFLSEKLGALICHLSFPLGTFMANMLGCLIIGLLYGYLDKTGKLSKTQNALWITGFCGGFTTFSSFSHDAFAMIQKGEWIKFILYVVPSVALGLLFVWLGMSITD